MKLRLNDEGFSIIEFMVIVLALAVLAFIGLTNLRAMRAGNRDEARKTDINALTYQLEAHHDRVGYYPKSLSRQTLPGIAEENLIDTVGKQAGTAGSEYRYTPRSCEKTKCRSFELSVELEREAPFIKESLQK